MSTNDFIAYPKTPRLFRDIVITEKLDGTNSQILIVPRAEVSKEEIDNPTTPFMSVDEFVMLAGSRNRWLTGKEDNYGFGKWVSANREELLKLGPGRHFGEWWGGGIQRGYGLKGDDKRFSLFNVARWSDGAVTADKWEKGQFWPGGQPLPPRPSCCGVVPVLYRGPFDTAQIRTCLNLLDCDGSVAVPGWAKPEGIIVFHTAANRAFKVLLENDEAPKGIGE